MTLGVTRKFLNSLVYGIRQIFVDGEEQTARARLNLKNVTVVDDTVNDWLEVTVDGATPSNNIPADLGTAAAGVSTEVSRSDHVHAHGAQLGGTLHAVVGASAGFMSAADKTKLDGIAASDAAPQDVGTAAAGVSTNYSRADHVHAHGSQLGGGLHATATSLAAGFMRGSDVDLLDGATDTAAVGTLALRDGSGTCDFAGLGITPGAADGIINWEAAATSAQLTQTQRGSAGAGAPMSVRAQRGNGGAGGSLTLGGGDPGTAGTHVPGDTIIELGTPIVGGQSGSSAWRANGALQRFFYFESALTRFVDNYYAPCSACVVDLRFTSNSFATICGLSENGIAVGGDPIANQNRTLYIANLAPSAAPTGGVFIFSESGAAKAWEPNGVRHEMATRDTSSGGTTKRILDRMGRLTSTTAATQTVLTIAAADLPTGEFVGRITVDWVAYDTSGDKNAGGQLVATIRGIVDPSLVVSVMTTAANQQRSPIDNDTTSVDTATTKPEIDVSGNDLRVRVTTLNTNNVRFAARVRDFLIVEH